MVTAVLVGIAGLGFLLKSRRRIRPPPRRSLVIGRSLAQGPTCGSQARRWSDPPRAHPNQGVRSPGLNQRAGAGAKGMASVRAGVHRPPCPVRLTSLGATAEIGRSTRRWLTSSCTVQSGQGAEVGLRRRDRIHHCLGDAMQGSLPRKGHGRALLPGIKTPVFRVRSR
jgi:hypothetical protein